MESADSVIHARTVRLSRTVFQDKIDSVHPDWNRQSHPKYRCPERLYFTNRLLQENTGRADGYRGTFGHCAHRHHIECQSPQVEETRRDQANDCQSEHIKTVPGFDLEVDR